MHANFVTLNQDFILTGSTDLNWTDKTIIGNGFKVSAGPGYTGRVMIANSTVIGLGSFGELGMSVTTGGSVSIQNSIFEATGAMQFNANGGGAVTVKNNEFRANNLLTYVSSNPSVPVLLQLDGSAAGAKVIQGNRIGGGILLVNGGNAWQIGGVAAGEGNVLMGPRGVLEIFNSSNNKIQGNYMLHDYHGGFSQGFNSWLQGSSGGELAEHNVIVNGSWPI